MASLGTIPVLPQELIDQIIDEVAYYDDFDPQISLDTLKSCALVSRAFNSRSRCHLLSTVNLVVDHLGRKRAGRLLRILRRRGVQTPAIQNIHRFNLLVEFRISDTFPALLVRSGMYKPYIRARNFLSRWLDAVGLLENPTSQVLKIMGETPLTHFGLGRRGSLIRWSTKPLGIDTRILLIVSKTSLRSLEFYNLTNFPEIHIKTAFQNSSLTDMRLYCISLARGGELIPLPKIQSTHAKIKTMELLFVSYQALLAIIRTLELEKANTRGSPSSHICPGYSCVFSCVHTLGVSIPTSRGEQEALSVIIQSVAPSLTSLRIESDGQIDMHSGQLDPIKLGTLQGLKHLDFSSTMFREDPGIGIPADMYLLNFFSSATSPMVLESISITLKIVPDDHGNLGAIFRPSEGWTLLDSALNNPRFVKLKSVVVNVKAIIYDDTSRPVMDVQMKETGQLLPIMAASPSVDTRINLTVAKCALDFRSRSYPFES